MGSTSATRIYQTRPSTPPDCLTRLGWAKGFIPKKLAGNLFFRLAFAFATFRLDFKVAFHRLTRDDYPL